ncbi:MAG: response regulator [Pseudomonadota bacterium]
MKKARVIIVEDEVAVRQGLSDWLSQEYEVSPFESAEAFLEAINDFEFEDGLPTCILLDFQMPGMTGVELQSNLKLMSVSCPIIFMSGNAQQADVIDAWRGGAIDFILKPFSGSQVSTALEDLFKKMRLLEQESPRVKTEVALIDIPISQREAEVLLLLGKGHRQNEAAEMLGITLRTIKMHRASLKNKLSLNTLVDLTRYCDEHRPSIEKIIERK